MNTTPQPHAGIQVLVKVPLTGYSAERAAADRGKPTEEQLTKAHTMEAEARRAAAAQAERDALAQIEARRAAAAAAYGQTPEGRAEVARRAAEDANASAYAAAAERASEAARATTDGLGRAAAVRESIRAKAGQLLSQSYDQNGNRT